MLFFSDADYEHFCELLAIARTRFPVDVYGYCLMPNHFHLLLAQRAGGAISAYLHLVTCISACSIRKATETIGLGHVYQRRFWSRVTKDDSDYLIALRYVEANALRAQLVKRAEEWPWGSLSDRLRGARRLLAPSPISLPSGWTELVNDIQSAQELEAMRTREKKARRGTCEKGV